MAITNPSTLLASFDANETNIAPPPAGQQSDGYTVNEIPEADNHGYMFNEYYKWLNYLKKNGMAQYDAALSYNKHSRVMRNQNIYRSLSDANSGNDPLTSPTFWQIDQWRMNTVTHNMASDANYTLTDEQNNYGKVIITDTGVLLTAGRNIIVSDEQKDFIAQNDTLQTLTFKTSGGTGIAVDAGSKVWLLCDGTNVIESVDAAGGGKILQVVPMVVKTDTFSTAASAFTDITGLSASITPTSATSKILIMANVYCGSATGQQFGLRLLRDATPIAIGDAAGSRTQASSAGRSAESAQIINNTINFEDSPATVAATTYKIQGFAEAAQTLYVNRSATDSDSAITYRPISTIYLMEIGV